MRGSRAPEPGAGASGRVVHDVVVQQLRGLRVAVVSAISLASVGQLIGVSQLGYLFVDGEQRAFPTEVYVGLVLVIALAIASDLVLVGIRRALTPWAVRS